MTFFPRARLRRPLKSGLTGLAVAGILLTGCAQVRPTSPVPPHPPRVSVTRPPATAGQLNADEKETPPAMATPTSAAPNPATSQSVPASALTPGAVTPSTPPSAPPSSGPVTTPSATPTSVPTTPAPGTPRPATVDCAKLKCIALTFDDGPSANSHQVLDTLKAKGAKATFFVLGERAREFPKAVRRMVDEGHAVGNHSDTHPQFWDLTRAAIDSELSRTNRAIEKATGTKVTLMRPPYGQSNDTIRSVERRLGLAQILWSLDSRDWKTRDTKKTADRVVKNAKPGAIVLMHEIHACTREALPTIIDGLRKKGYTLVTVPELLGTTKAGVSYSQRK